MIRIVNKIRAAWLRWCLQCNVDFQRQYGEDLRRNGIPESESLREFRRQADALRVQIALLEAA